MSTELHSPLDALLERMQADVHTRKRDLLGRLAPIEDALQSYRLALESALARDLAGSHSLPRPAGAVLSPEAAAARLFDLVRSLPELKAPEKRQPESAQTQNPPKKGNVTLAGPLSPVQTPVIAGPAEQAEQSAAYPFPKLVATSRDRRLALVGALSGRRKKFPAPFDEIVEWIDTAQGGAHAVGNLATRIRQGRVSGLILCDQAISHKHSEPVVAAARATHVPVAFAGKGGAQSILRAFQAIEDQL